MRHLLSTMNYNAGSKVWEAARAREASNVSQYLRHNRPTSNVLRLTVFSNSITYSYYTKLWASSYNNDKLRVNIQNYTSRICWNRALQLLKFIFRGSFLYQLTIDLSLPYFSLPGTLRHERLSFLILSICPLLCFSSHAGTIQDSNVAFLR